MNTLRKWESTGEGKYAFFDNGKEIGSIEIARATSESTAQAKIGSREITLKKTGTWKNTIEITDKKDVVIAKAYPENWYANVWKLDYAGKTYTLKVRNNPMAEYVIVRGNEEIISYGLTTNKGKTGVKINSNQTEPDYIFDYLLWYLFAPVAFENTGNELMFILMMA